MTRDEHVQWCKDRALEYYNSGDLANAVASHWTFAFLPRTLRSSITIELGR